MLPKRLASSAQHNGTIVLKLVACSLFVANCSPVDMTKNNNDRLRDVTYGTKGHPEIDPLDGAAHMSNGMSLLARSGKSSGELYFARSAFERAAALRIDDANPHFLSGYSNYLLGDYEAAYQSFVAAANLDKHADGWWLASLSALRARKEFLAQALYQRGARADQARSISLSSFMATLYSGSDGLEVVAKNITPYSDEEFVCKDPEDEVDAVNVSCTGDAKVEIFIVERNSSAGARIGQDLVGNLSVGLSGNLFGYDRSVSRDKVSGTRDDTLNTASNISVDLQSINYALSFAADDESVAYVNSMPVLTARLGSEAKVFSGQTVKLLAGGDRAKDGIDEEIGTTVSFNLVGFTESEAMFDAEVELSNYVPPKVNGNFAQLETDTTNVAASGRVPFNQAFLLGSLEYTERADFKTGQTGIRNVPVIGNLFGKHESGISRTETAVLAIVRPPTKIGYNQEIIDLLAYERFGLKASDKVSRRPLAHTAPSLSLVLHELGLIQ